jgi:hypothetical protein
VAEDHEPDYEITTEIIGTYSIVNNSVVVVVNELLDPPFPEKIITDFINTIKDSIYIKSNSCGKIPMTIVVKGPFGAESVVVTQNDIALPIISISKNPDIGEEKYTFNVIPKYFDENNDIYITVTNTEGDVRYIGEAYANPVSKRLTLIDDESDIGSLDNIVVEYASIFYTVDITLNVPLFTFKGVTGSLNVFYGNDVSAQVRKLTDYLYRA